MFQNPSEIIDVSLWSADEDNPIYPEGAREKNLLISPMDIQNKFPFIIAGHRYLFKKSISRHPIQFWSEVIAYRVGVCLGVTVPPALVAYNSKTKEYGALIEWFYHGEQRYSPGGEWMQKLIKDYDREKGRQHNLSSIIYLGNVLTKSTLIANVHADWNITWAKILTFDALIGNTDRHQENWGIIFSNFIRKMKDIFIRDMALSPAFDNGTSLIYEILEEDLDKKFDTETKQKAYIARGRHQMKINKDDDKKAKHLELIASLILTHPELKSVVIEVLDNVNNLDKALDDILKFQIEVPFTEKRLGYIKQIILKRSDMLREMLDQI